HFFVHKLNTVLVNGIGDMRDKQFQKLDKQQGDEILEQAVMIDIRFERRLFHHLPCSPYHARFPCLFSPFVSQWLPFLRSQMPETKIHLTEQKKDVENGIFQMVLEKIHMGNRQILFTFLKIYSTTTRKIALDKAFCRVYNNSI